MIFLLQNVLFLYIYSKVINNCMHMVINSYPQENIVLSHFEKVSLLPFSIIHIFCAEKF